VFHENRRNLINSFTYTPASEILFNHYTRRGKDEEKMNDGPIKAYIGFIRESGT
jgi:hypothetical protein